MSSELYRLQLLATLFEFHVDPAVQALLRWLAPEADHAEAPIETAVIEVVRSGTAWTIRSSWAEETHYDIYLAAHRTLQLATTYARRRVGPALQLLAVLGGWGGANFLIVGGARSGKSVLALNLICEGADIQGDNRALLIDDDWIAEPRRFEIFEADLCFVKQRPRSDGYDRTDRELVHRHRVGFSPLDWGEPWRIARLSRVRAVFFLQPSSGGRSRLRACTAMNAVERLIACQTESLPGASPVQAFERLLRLVNSTEVFVLDLQDAPSAVRVVKQCLGDIVEQRV